MADDSIAFDLSSFPLPEAIQTLDSEAIIGRMAARLVANWPEIAGIVDLESEPSRKLIEVFAFEETLIRQRVNDAVRANLLRFALGADLDNLAVFYDVVRLSGELDDAFKRRVILAIQGRSTGGTAPRYRAVALGASVRVADAIVYRDGTSPVVNVAVYSTDNNGVPDAGLLATVAAALNAPSVRMVSDTIVVRAAAFTTVNVVADVWLLPETPDTLITPPSPGVDSPLAATVRAAWLNESGLGFDLVPEWISSRLMVAGIQRAVPLVPSAPVVAAPANAVAIGTITLNNRGRAV